MPELFMLDLKDTKVRERVLSEGIQGIEAGRVHHFLSSQGFEPDPLEGVTVHANGLVSVWLDTDPVDVWVNFANEPPPADVVTAQAIDKLKAFRENKRAGRVTPKDLEDTLELVVGSMLKAYGIEDD